MNQEAKTSKALMLVSQARELMDEAEKLIVEVRSESGYKVELPKKEVVDEELNILCEWVECHDGTWNPTCDKGLDYFIENRSFEFCPYCTGEIVVVK